MTRIAITGHRPNRLPDPEWVKEALRQAYRDLGVTQVIQGMAEGADLVAAGVAWQEGIPFIAVRPWAGHGNAGDALYQWALRNAERVEVLNESVSFPGNAAFHVRNQWMVDHAELVIAVWNGVENGGTYQTVRYARKTHKPIFILDPSTKSIIGMETNAAPSPEPDLFS